MESGSQAVAQLTEQLAPDAYRRRPALRVEGFSAEPTIETLVDAYDGNYDLSWTANPSIARWRGELHVLFDGNRSGGTVENAAGQRCQWLRKADAGSWVDGGEVFSASATAANPLAGDGHIQPCVFAPQGDVGPLLCVWQTHSAAFVSTLTSPTGKWTTRRFEWDGWTPVVSATITGAAGGGRSLTASLDGISDLQLFFPCSPTVLQDGTIAAPVTLYSSATVDPASRPSDATFWRLWKCNAVMFSPDAGATWTISEPIPFGPDSRPSASWEPFLVEDAAGRLRVFSRNAQTLLTSEVAQLVTASENRRAWAPARATGLETPPQRGHAVRTGPSRWVFAQADNSGLQSATGVQGRFNGAIFSSRTGEDDFVPAVAFTEPWEHVVYPALLVEGGTARVVWTQDVSDRRSLLLSTVSVPTREDRAYVFRRRAGERALSGPQRLTSPARLGFRTSHRATAATALNHAGDFTLAALLTPRSIGIEIILDTRSPSEAAGIVLQPTGVSVRSIALAHGLALSRNVPTFLAAAVSLSARRIRHLVSVNGAAMQTRDTFIRVLRLTAVPADGETIQVNGVTFTFRTSPAGTTDVARGATIAATATNLAGAIVAQGLRATTIGDGTYVGAARVDGVDIAATGSANVSVPSALPSLLTASTIPRVGAAPLGITSGLPGLNADVFAVQAFDAALTDAEVIGAYNAVAASAGLGTLSGGSAPPATTCALTPGSTTSTFPDVDDAPNYAVVTASAASLYGEACAPVELPWAATTLSLRFRLAAAPTGGQKVVLASVDTKLQPIRLYVQGSAPTTLRLNGTTVGMLPSDPTRWADLEITVTPDVVIVGDVAVRRAALGDPRVYLGQAWPENLLPRTFLTEFDLSNMAVAEFRGRAKAISDPASVTVRPATSTSDGLVVWREGLAYPSLIIDGGGKIKMGTGTAAPIECFRGTSVAQVFASAEIRVDRASITSALSTTVTGDTSPRFVVTTDGGISVGSGVAARDTNLFRDAAGNRWKTDDQLWAAAGLASAVVGDVAGLTSAQIDALAAFGGVTPVNGTMVVALNGADTVLLERRNNQWWRSPAFTAIA